MGINERQRGRNGKWGGMISVSLRALTPISL